MDKRTKELHRIMLAHGLSAAEVANLMKRSEQTVRIWRCKSKDRIIPEHTLELLRMKVSSL